MPSDAARPRPRLKLASVLILAEIDGYINRYGVASELPTAASDVCDGAWYRYELDELIRKRLFRIVNDESDAPLDEELCGCGWTVYLTDKAIQYFWKGKRNA